MKLNHLPQSRPLRLFFSAIVFSLAVLMIMYACKKQEISTEQSSISEDKFFYGSENVNPLVKRIAASLRLQNEKEHMVKKLAMEEGLPIWNKILLETVPQFPGDTLVTIPLVPEGSGYVGSFILYHLGAKNSFSRLYRGRKYASYGLGEVNKDGLNGDFVAARLMLLNKLVFSTKRFQINDPRLFGLKKDSAVRGSIYAEITAEGQNSHSLARTDIKQQKPVNVEAQQSVASEPTNASPSDNPIIVIPPCTIFVFTDEDGNVVGLGGSLSRAKECTIEIINITVLANGGGGPGGPAGGSGPGSSGGYYPGGGIGSGGSGSGGMPPLDMSMPECGAGMTQAECDAIIMPFILPIPPVPDMPTYLTELATAVDTKANEIFTTSQQNTEEWGFMIAKETSGTIAWKNAKTNHNPIGMLQNKMIGNAIALGELHTHPAETSKISDRSAPSGSDFYALKLQQKDYVIFIECGNLRYALVVEDKAKMMAFLKGKDPYQLDEDLTASAYKVPGYNNDWQNATQVALLQMLGDAANCGIGVYKSDATKKNFTKLNP